jgi:hypothetical protein
MVYCDQDGMTDEVFAETRESSFAWELRVMVVSAVWAVPGLLAGPFARLFIPDGGPAELWLIGGGLLGVAAGGFLESDHWWS